jgi:apolipoprotein D and lipocalin family protein
MISWHVGPGRDGKYKVRYLWPFSGTYWVIALAPDYRWAVVGSPSQRYLWILSRTSSMPPQKYAELIQFAAQQGYDAARIQPTLQRGQN